MATVKLPKHKANLTVYVDKTLRKQLHELARGEGIKLTDYLRRILIFAAKHQAKIQEGSVIFPGRNDPIASLSESKDPPAAPPQPPKRPVNYRRK